MPTAVITGTSSGIGHATVTHFLQQNWHVLATVRQESDLHLFPSPNVTTLLLDVSDEASCLTFATRALSASPNGRIDALINNAGVLSQSPLEYTPTEAIHSLFQVNVLGLIGITKSFLPVFREQGFGVIVNIASITGVNGYPYSSVYSASKGAVIALSEGLSIELEEFGVKCKVVIPGHVVTPIIGKVEVGEVGEYTAGMGRYFGAHGGGSTAGEIAEVIFGAVVDGNSRVRYYAGRDAVGYERGRRMLGEEWWFEEFRKAKMGKASELWKMIVPGFE